MRIDYRVTLPAAVHALKTLDDVIRAVPLEPRLLELVRIRASQLNGCAYCVELHTNTARSLGEDEKRLTLLSVWRGTYIFSRRERAALTWCEALTDLATTVGTPGGYEDVSAVFADEEIVGLTLAIIAINGWNRLRIALDGPDGRRDGVHPSPSTAVGTDPAALELAAHLRRLEEEIAEVRAEYERATAGPPSPRYYESGSVHPELDDQSITP
jgi:AhpD family alkylhydroperoxidase